MPKSSSWSIHLRTNSANYVTNVYMLDVQYSLLELPNDSPTGNGEIWMIYIYICIYIYHNIVLTIGMEFIYIFLIKWWAWTISMSITLITSTEWKGNKSSIYERITPQFRMEIQTSRQLIHQHIGCNNRCGSSISHTRLFRTSWGVRWMLIRSRLVAITVTVSFLLS